MRALTKRQEQTLSFVRESIRARGYPPTLLAHENIIDTVQVDPELLKGGAHVFGLKMHGATMVGDGIQDGDYLFVRRQTHAERDQIVVALIEHEAIVRRYRPEEGYVRLVPSSSTMPPILVAASDWVPNRMLIGKVVGLWRRFA